MKAAELREQFLAYFERHGHTRVASSSLVPSNDPTLFFTNAGMVPFKEIFTGKEVRSYSKACSSQKCMRVSGKHNDLENVGHTPRHHTFFEMLGNFSFGDYFKKEAIPFAWEFLTKEIRLDPHRMYITIFQDDDEAEELWKKHVPKNRIFRFGEEENFWAMGETGPCGPCSEIHWDFEKGGVRKEDFATDRFMEIWNLVFMQFNRNADGSMERLAKPSIDTGMGLERLAAVVQGVKSNWETDLFTPLVKRGQALTGHRETESPRVQISLRVIADHIRATTFLISDGVTPSNEGRGYVLRRIMRRAIRHGKQLGMDASFFWKMASVVIDEMKDAYPELLQHREFIERVISTEEESFYKTLERGLNLIDEYMIGEEFKAKRERRATKRVLPGEVVFKLHDTFGFPKDLTQIISSEKKYTIDEVGFERCMHEQRTRARKSWKGSGEVRVDPVWQQLAKKGITTQFVGYEKNRATSQVSTIVIDGQEIEEGGEGAQIAFVTERTPFYGEAGGQVGDTGRAIGQDVEVEIVDTIKPVPDLHVHIGEVRKGRLAVGMNIELAIDAGRRDLIRKNHTGTHLLHKALRSVLGEHVKQAGSLVDENRLRFDFSHFQGVTIEEITQIEKMANEAVDQDIKVETHIIPYQKAIARGALAFFGDKYGDVVRMVEVGDVSRELCGGTHVASTGEIGRIKITSESSVAAGTRRIEAVVGAKVREWEKAQVALQREEAARHAEREAIKGEAEKEKGEALKRYIDLIEQAEEFGGAKFLVARVDVPDIATLRELAEQQRNKLGSGVVFLGADINNKASLIAMVTKDLTKQVSAGEIIRSTASAVGGKGGGRPDMAQGGGPDVKGLVEALNEGRRLLRRLLNDNNEER